ncbi:hypothetical protein [Antarctobacter heliothermus]|uniref:Uncharacterized protein n=1 Tax=Antarctobacter heliothermus TaxID=74033 RepID=A0A239CCZ2_9RHOB|nr:hypothetical protein [Antarctobacter heliothermus]SNS18085.1 hypothetical protein SAMN04488078_100679 [Antarctobacter heliothermus]
MPATYRVLPQLNIVLVLFRGDITVDQNVETLLRYRSDPLFDGGQHTLLDVMDCTFPDGFFAETARLANRLRPYHEARDPRARSSIFAPGKVNYGICKLYRDAVQAKLPYPVDVFRDPESALRFLDLDPVDIEVRGLLGQATRGFASS